jgi:hypothetical protein
MNPKETIDQKEKSNTIHHNLYLNSKNFVLPILLLLFFSYQIYIFYSLSNIPENYMCDLKEKLNEIDSSRKNNELDLSNESINKSVIEFEKLLNRYHKEMKLSDFNQNLFLVSEIVNPYFPYPCELFYTNNCRYYINEKTFNCTFLSEPSEITSLFSIPEYKSISPYILTLHLAIIFVIGYLISFIIFFILRNLKIKKTLIPLNIVISNK